MWKNKAAATTAAALALLLAAAPTLPAYAVTEQEAKSYEQQAQQKKQKSDEIQGRINNFSEEKRQLDEEAERAIAEHKEAKAALDETERSMKENEARLDVLAGDYDKKRTRLGKRVRDIYINGQISYLDVLFGAKDFGDLLTRMDLLKRVVRDDYELVHTVLTEQAEIEQRQKQLASDRSTQAEQEQEARTAREIMEQKVAKQQALLYDAPARTFATSSYFSSTVHTLFCILCRNASGPQDSSILNHLRIIS